MYAMFEVFDHSCHSYLLNVYCVSGIFLGTGIHMVQVPFRILLFTSIKLSPNNPNALPKQREYSFFFFLKSHISEKSRRESDFDVIGLRNSNDFITRRFFFIPLLSFLYVDSILR